MLYFVDYLRKLMVLQQIKHILCWETKILDLHILSQTEKSTSIRRTPSKRLILFGIIVAQL